MKRIQTNTWAWYSFMIDLDVPSLPCIEWVYEGPHSLKFNKYLPLDVPQPLRWVNQLNDDFFFDLVPFVILLVGNPMYSCKTCEGAHLYSSVVPEPGSQLASRKLQTMIVPATHLPWLLTKRSQKKMLLKVRFQRLKPWRNVWSAATLARANCSSRIPYTVLYSIYSFYLDRHWTLVKVAVILYTPFTKHRLILTLVV